MARSDGEQGSAARPVRVVLADDEPMLRRGLRVLLETDTGIRVVAEAGNGDELLHAVHTYTPDVALVDVQMPGKGGLAALREFAALADPPVAAVLTTFDLDDYVDEALRVGAHGFLLKDAEPSMLIRAVRDLASGGAVLDPRITARLLPRFRSFGDHGHEVKRIAELSARERQVLRALGAGRSNADIGGKLGLTEATVKSYVSTVLTKLGAENRVQAALMAQRAGGSTDA